MVSGSDCVRSGIWGSVRMRRKNDFADEMQDTPIPFQRVNLNPYDLDMHILEKYGKIWYINNITVFD